MRVFVVSSSLHFLKTISQIGFFRFFYTFSFEVPLLPPKKHFFCLWSVVFFAPKIFWPVLFSVCDFVLFHLHIYLSTNYFLFSFRFGFCPSASLNSVPWNWLKALPLPYLSKIVQFHHMLSHCDRSQEVFESFFFCWWKRWCLCCTNCPCFNCICISQCVTQRDISIFLLPLD